MARRYKRDSSGRFAGGGGGSSSRKKGQSRRAYRKANLNKVRHVEVNTATGRVLKVTNRMHENRVAGSLYGALAGSVVGPLGTIAGAGIGYNIVAARQQARQSTSLSAERKKATTTRKRSVGDGSTIRTQVSR